MRITVADAYPASLKLGSECLHIGGETLPYETLAFWQWSSSDLLGNTTRGVLAEYIVACALNSLREKPRQEWVAYDILTPEGIKVEVKSSAYLQTWKQKKPSTISFGIAPTKGWDPVTGWEVEEQRRHADVYVFALLAHKDKLTVDPLDLSQWIFYVLPTKILDTQLPSQKTVGLQKLLGLGAVGVNYVDLTLTVVKAARSHDS